MVNNIWKPYPRLKKQLEETQDFVLSKVQIRNQEISSLISNLLKSGGKMTRPAFFYLFSDFGDRKNNLVEAAASLEVLHLATLIHDDVIDNSPLRRNVPTIHSRVGMRNAIYAGDLLFTIYFDLLAKVSPERKDILMNSDSMQKVLLGELDQMLINDNPDATVKMYLREISGKTARLFSLSAEFGAIMGNADERIAKQAKFIGHDIGMAFQMIDDLLDYTGSKKTGKPTYEDLDNRTYSLPIIMALNNDSGELRRLLQLDELTAEQKQEAVRLIEKNNGLVETKRIADHYTIRALDRIKTLPDGENKKILIKITKQMLKRNN